MSGTLLAFGYGYSAQALGARLLDSGWTVIGTWRKIDAPNQLLSKALTLVSWDSASAPEGEIPERARKDGVTDRTGEPAAERSRLREALGRATHLLISIAPDAGGDPVLRDFGAQIAARAGHLKWVGYLSTTGVYGDHGGGWVDENTALTPTTRRGQQRGMAETEWQDLAARYGLPLHIFRLAGIYGPGRGPFAKVRSGSARRIIKAGQVFSRIHVEDIATVLEASIARPDPGAIYNVCDDEAAPPEDVIAHAAKLLGMPVPAAEDYATAEMTPMARSFYAESKRVRNNRIKRDLGVKLRYPNYRDGLAALLTDDETDQKRDSRQEN